jgi:Uri superfamily endonuclease
MDDLPIQPGNYTLLLELVFPEVISVGCLGQFGFPAGIYAYQGSANGPGGLRARLGRHITGNGQLHWHIDYLRKVSNIVGYGFVTLKREIRPIVPLECEWSQDLLGVSGASTPVPKFGASDCTSGCQAHLVHFLNADFVNQFSSKFEVNMMLPGGCPS